METNDDNIYTIYYNKINIDNKNKLVTVDSDCPNITHIGEDEHSVHRVAKMFIKQGVWHTWFCPEISDLDYKFKGIASVIQ